MRALLPVALCVVVGCHRPAAVVVPAVSPADRVFQERVRLINEAAAVVETSTDEASAKAAQPRADEIARQLRANGADFDRLLKSSSWEPSTDQVFEHANAQARFGQAVLQAKATRNTADIIRELGDAISDLEAIRSLKPKK